MSGEKSIKSEIDHDSRLQASSRVTSAVNLWLESFSHYSSTIKQLFPPTDKTIKTRSTEIERSHQSKETDS